MTVFIETENEEVAKKEAAWACMIAEVVGGYMAFETYDDYKTWKDQK